jgi:uncharacterized protein YpiB (UPF0302 family)
VNVEVNRFYASNKIETRLFNVDSALQKKDAGVFMDLAVFYERLKENKPE